MTKWLNLRQAFFRIAAAAAEASEPVLLTAPSHAVFDLETAAFVFHMGGQDLGNHQVFASRVFFDP